MAISGDVAGGWLGGSPPVRMRCVEIVEPGGPEVLQAMERPVPPPLPGDALIRVAAAGVNRPDALQRAGAYPPPEGASDLPGLEVAGTVVAVAGERDLGRVGEQVMALVPGGGYAEFVRVPLGHCLPWPRSLSAREAAAIPETLFTVWHNVLRLGRLREGETLLVHGGSSGIGTMAIQIGRAVGARVIVTAGSGAKCSACERLGASAINYREEDFVAAVRDRTEGRGADVILDMVGGDYVQRNYRAAAMHGRVVQIATLGGAEATANVSMIMTKRLVHTGSTLRPQPDSFKARLAAELTREVLPLIDAGTIRPVMDRVFPLEDARSAHEWMEAGRHIGKIVLTVGEGGAGG